MKRCPECRRDYTDETLNYCLDDGTPLLDGPASDEASTAVFPDPGRPVLAPERRRIQPAVLIGLLLAAVFIVGGTYLLRTRKLDPQTGPSQTAYDNYMRAKVLLASENKEDDDAAINLLEQTVRDDPQYAPAWAALGRAYNIRAFYFARADERKQLNQNAQVAVEKALAIDPNLAEAHFVRGLILWSPVNGFQHEQTVYSYKRALELDPKLDEAHHQLALVYLHIGLLDKAWAEIGRALEINPANTLARYRYGVIDLYRGKYEDAYSISKSTPLEKNPSLHESQAATILFRLGRVDEAQAIVDRYLAQYPDDPGGIVTSVKAMILASRGQTKEAETAIKRAEDVGKDFGHFHHSAYNIACAYAMLKKPDQAVDYLQKAVDDGFPCYPLFERDELLKEIKQHPRYIALLAQLKQQWERYNATL